MYPMASRSTDAVSVCHRKREGEVSPGQDLVFLFFFSVKMGLLLQHDTVS